MVARGVLNIAGFHQIFVEVIRLTEPHSDCEILIHLVDATYDLEATQVLTISSAKLPGRKNTKSLWLRRAGASTLINRRY